MQTRLSGTQIEEMEYEIQEKILTLESKER
jgi:hypothetical protein